MTPPTIVRRSRMEYRRDAAYLLSVFRVMDGVTISAPRISPKALEEHETYMLEKTYVDELTSILAVTGGRDFLQVSDLFTIRIDYMPIKKPDVIDYVFRFSLCAGYSEMGKITYLELRDDKLHITAHTGDVISVDLRVPEGTKGYMDIIRMAQVFLKMRKGYDFVLMKEVGSWTTQNPMDMVYINDNSGTSLPLSEWKQKAHVGYRKMEDVVTQDEVDLYVDDPEKRLYGLNGVYRTLDDWEKVLGVDISGYVSSPDNEEKGTENVDMKEVVNISQPNELIIHRNRFEVPITCRGETYTLREWMMINGLTKRVVNSRLARGESMEQVIRPIRRHTHYIPNTEPLKPRKPGYLISEKKNAEGNNDT